MEKVRVRFIIVNKRIIALFPDVIADYNGDILSYESIGQHCAASKELMKRKKATPEQYEKLKKELENIGYNLEVI